MRRRRSSFDVKRFVSRYTPEGTSHVRVSALSRMALGFRASSLGQWMVPPLKWQG